jgi:hypothetical protein
MKLHKGTISKNQAFWCENFVKKFLLCSFLRIATTLAIQESISPRHIHNPPIELAQNAYPASHRLITQAVFCSASAISA